jgi:hypothetical protein
MIPAGIHLPYSPIDHGLLTEKTHRAFQLSAVEEGGGVMKALALLTAAVVTLFSVAASAQTYGVPYGKGKAPPPPPVVTKG